MNIFVDVLNNIFVISVIIAFVFLFKDLHLALDLIKTINKNRENLERWKFGVINLDDIHSLTPREFEFWCGEFISTIGYSNIKQTPLGPDGGKDIICKFKNKPAYVECKSYVYGNSVSYKVDEDICKKLVGAMVHDDINNGLVITSGLISKDCCEYVKTLPNNLKIKLIDGPKIVDLYITLHSKQHIKTA